MCQARGPLGTEQAADLAARSAWLEQHVIPHEPCVRRKLARMGVAADLVEDVVQDAYLRLLNAESVMQVRDSRSYFLRAAASVVLSKVRRDKCVKQEAHEEAYFAQLPSPEPDPEAVLDSKRRVEKVQKAINELGARARAIVVMRRLERLTGRQTSERMRISESAVEKHLSAAMRTLRQASSSGTIPANDKHPTSERWCQSESKALK